MLALILGFITGLVGPISESLNRITALKEARVKADSDKDLAKINSELEQVHDRKALLIAEAGNRIAGTVNVFTRTALALGPIAILLKIAYDKVFGSFAGCAVPNLEQDFIYNVCYKYRTDAIDPNMWWVIIACVGFYFLTSKPRN